MSKPLGERWPFPWSVQTEIPGMLGEYHGIVDANGRYIGEAVDRETAEDICKLVASVARLEKLLLLRMRQPAWDWSRELLPDPVE